MENIFPQAGRTLYKQRSAGTTMHALANRASQIISGKRSITEDTALRLGKCFNTDPDYWLGLQAQYELEKLESQTKTEIAAIAPLSSLKRP